MFTGSLSRMSFITLKSASSISNLLSVFNHGDWWILWNIFLDSIELSIRFCPLLYQKFGLSLNSAVSLPGSTAESMKLKATVHIVLAFNSPLGSINLCFIYLGALMLHVCIHKTDFSLAFDPSIKNHTIIFSLHYLWFIST